MAKGQKICKSCQRATGPRTKVCACGTHFEIKEAKVKREETRKKTVSKKVEAGVINLGPPMIYAVTAQHKTQCPPLPKKLDKDTIIPWLASLQEYSVKSQFGWCKYAKSAVYGLLLMQFPKLPLDAHMRLQALVDKHWIATEEELRYRKIMQGRCYKSLYGF